MKERFYITTTLPYVNADPHLGHAMEFVRADSVARYKKQMGFDVFFNTGTDEHGQKIYTKAVEEKADLQEYVDRYSRRFKDLITTLNLSADIHFVRTTDTHHRQAAQEFWRRCSAAGDIYKKTYKIKYCVGCELEKTESELVDGKCPLHPNQQIELIDEENYFFKFSKYQKPLLAFYEQHPDFVIPSFRFNEIKAFVERGLEDFSISRLKSKMPWGVDVPDDPDHIMYVWFDALVNYISTIGWPDDTKTFEQWWPVTQYAGKDNLRQQSAMWQAMLMSAGIEPSKQIVINGFITGAGGIKMSKSLGNVVSPVDVINEYGTDAFRYFVLREIPSFEDGEFTVEKFKRAYNDGLANGLGNLVSRVMKLAETNLSEPVSVLPPAVASEYKDALNAFNLKVAMDFVWGLISQVDQSIQTERPFSVVKTDPEKGQALIKDLVSKLNIIAMHIAPFMPETSQKIVECITANKTPEKPLFMRKD